MTDYPAIKCLIQYFLLVVGQLHLWEKLYIHVNFCITKLNFSSAEVNFGSTEDDFCTTEDDFCTTEDDFCITEVGR
eukprot:15332020-Ditylum_brightwellii.AAC.1